MLPIASRKNEENLGSPRIANEKHISLNNNDTDSYVMNANLFPQVEC